MRAREIMNNEAGRPASKKKLSNRKSNLEKLNSLRQQKSQASHNFVNKQHDLSNRINKTIQNLSE